MGRLRVLARILAWQGNFCRLLGDRDQARDLHQQGLALLEGRELAGRDTRREKTLLFWLMGHTALLDNPQECRPFYQQSLALCRELDDKPGVARALNSLGTAGMVLGALDEARASYAEALGLHQALGDPRRIVRALASLAEIALLQGRFGEADRLAQQSVTKCEELGHQPESAFAWLKWGETLEVHGKFSQAQSALENSLAIYNHLGHHNYIASAHAELSGVNLHLAPTQKLVPTPGRPLPWLATMALHLQLVGPSPCWAASHSLEGSLSRPADFWRRASPSIARLRHDLGPASAGPRPSWAMRCANQGILTRHTDIWAKHCI